MENPEQIRGLGGRAWLLLVVYTASLLLFNLGGARTLTHHESHNVQAAREMLATGDWLLPRVGGQPWVEKPPLPHWSIAAVAGLTGVSDAFTARLPSALAGLLGVLLIAQLAARWFGPTVGLLCGLVQATTVYTVTYARLAEADIYLWLLILACLSCFAHQVVTPGAGSPWVRWAFFALLGLTNLAKGMLFGSMLVLAPCLAYLAWSRSRADWRWLLFPPGIALVVLIAVPWPLSVILAHPDTLELWRMHYLDRIASDACYNPQPVWYYLTTLPWQILPWTLLLLPALPTSWRQAWKERSPVDRFLWVWLLASLLLLSAMRAKHHHYLIHALPPCSIWAALGLARLGKWLPSPVARRWLHHGSWALLGLTVAGLVGIAGMPASPHRDAAIWIGLIVVLMSVVLAVGYRRGKLGWMTGGLFAGIWCILGCMHVAIMPHTDSYREETEVLNRFAAQAEPAQPVLLYGMDPTRVLIYCSSQVKVTHSFQELRDRGQKLGSSYLITPLANEDRVRQAGQLERVLAVSRPRHAHMGAQSQMGIYRVDWQPSTHPTALDSDH